MLKIDTEQTKLGQQMGFSCAIYNNKYLKNFLGTSGADFMKGLRLSPF